MSMLLAYLLDTVSYSDSSACLMWSCEWGVALRLGRGRVSGAWSCEWGVAL